MSTTANMHEDDDLENNIAIATLRGMPHGEFYLKMIKTVCDMSQAIGKDDLSKQIPSIQNLVSSLKNSVPVSSNDANVNQAVFKALSKGATTNLVVNPPSHFSKVPTLDSNDATRNQKVHRAFGNTKRTFSGKSKDGLTIIEFLDAMTRAQHQVVLSLEEFYTHVLNNLTGPAYQCAIDWVNQNVPVEEFYENMINRFNVDESPAQAEAMLKNIAKGEKSFENLALLEGEIARLARLTSYQVQQGEAREIIKNKVAIDTLKAMMPYHIAGALEGELSRTTTLKGRELTFDEYKKLVSLYQEGINKYLMKNKGRKQQQQGKQNNKHDKNVKEIEHEVHALDSSESTAKPKNKNYGKKTNNSGKGKGKGKNTNFQRSSSPKNSKKSMGASRLNSCSLCPSLKHTSDECPYFLAHEKTTVQELCSICEWERYHKEIYCPMKMLNDFKAQITGN